MCGVIQLHGKRLVIDCKLVDQDWWRHPWPPVDWTRILVGDNVSGAGPSPEPWRIELTKIGEVMAIAGRLQDRALADRLGNVAVEVANNIAEQAKVDTRFTWELHAQGTS